MHRLGASILHTTVIFSLGSQHPSPNVKNFPRFEPQIWPEIITSRDAESTCFKGSRTSCDVIIFGIFWSNFGRKRSHHVMDACCRFMVQETLGRPFLQLAKTPFVEDRFLSGGVLVLWRISLQNFLPQRWDPDCLVQGPNSCFSPKIDKGRSK